MNIAYLLRFWPVYGGGETSTRLLANELSARGHRIFIYYLWDRTEGINAELDDRIICRKIENISKPYGVSEIIKTDYETIIDSLSSFMASDNIDAVINQWWPSEIPYQARHNSKAKAKIIKCHHGQMEAVTLNHKIFDRLIGKYRLKLKRLRKSWKSCSDLRFSDKWIFLSESSAANAVNNYCASLFQPFDAEKAAKIGFIPNPLKYKDLSHSLKHKEKIILSVGRIIPLKRINLLLDVWALVKGRYGADGWKFVIIGDGPDLEREMNYARSIGCDDVVFTGYADPSGTTALRQDFWRRP